MGSVRVAICKEARARHDCGYPGQRIEDLQSAGVGESRGEGEWEGGENKGRADCEE